MRFLLDQGIARSVGELLASSGHAARHVSAIGMAEAADRDILLEARSSGEIVVTFDADFHAILPSNPGHARRQSASGSSHSARRKS